jgi:hypothetical protein
LRSIFLLLSTCFFCSSTTLFAADAKEFDYPELLVSPSASERLQQEAKDEQKSRWTNHWAIQASALATLMAGITSNSDPGKNVEAATTKGEELGSKSAAKAALYVGGSWLAITAGMSVFYSPYQNGWSRIQGMPQSSKKDKLAFERYAEEALFAPARVATFMKWASFLTNAGANAAIIQNAANSSTKTLGMIGIAGSTFPLIFDHHWSEIYRVQGEYKKKIYGSLTSANISILPHNNGMSAVSNLAWEF